MRARFTIGRASYIKGGVDADGYSRPAGFTPIAPVDVFGWQPLSSDMPVAAELTMRVITSKLLLVPDASIWKPGDKVWLSGVVVEGLFVPTDVTDVFHVFEDIRDYNTGPFGYRPGGAVVIERTRG